MVLIVVFTYPVRVSLVSAWVCVVRFFFWATVRPMASPSQARSKRQGKSIKAHEGRFSYVLGRDVYMDRVGSLCNHALIRRMEYCNMGKNDWVDWETIH